MKTHQPIGMKADNCGDRFVGGWGGRLRPLGSLGLALAMVGLSGCVAPIGADRVATRLAYAQVEATALRTGQPSSDTVSILHRYELDEVAVRRPDEAVQRLHEKAVATGDRGLLFALAELSFVAGERIDKSVQPWDPRRARDYYLGSAVYAWLFLFGDSREPAPSPFDRRFREACDFYNYGLGLAFTDRKSTNAVVRLEPGRRRLPVGELELRVDAAGLGSPLNEFEEILLADQFRVRGLSVRNREPGLGSPLICVRPLHSEFGIRPCFPATAFLHGPASLAALAAGTGAATLEVRTAFNGAAVSVAGKTVPLETDLTTFRAYTLNQSRVWKLGPLAFLAPAERIRSQLIINQPYDPNRIPIVLVHGTFSSPVTWAEMGNTLTADPVLRKRYQIWSFIYGSGNPLIVSIGDLRRALTNEVARLDPAGTNANLRQMVVIGHSQGGLLTKGTAVDVGHRLWEVYSTNKVEDLKISEEDRARLRNLFFPQPLPFVKRVVFIATPHRGSYLSGNLARRLAQRLVSLPGALLARASDLMKLTQGSKGGQFWKGRPPTSLDGMSPKNPGLLAVADLPVVPAVKAHSIIPVLGNGDPAQGRDGVVAYQSAHQSGVVSELVVRSGHSCLDHPATIEEVRRILHLHLRELPADSHGPAGQGQ